ncbi:4-(cytidine 5'-diphospho)-2-C-methyl-D-erythritol kinase [Thorsellia anophelis]|uniref:4-diphosphocytidyl-2-C-methyl-D-erythritol kinase n=1 Tax=Thorsellia anophelis DSM 18579 TaxID=1123402 RepID=A0A1I0EUW4_9GAMM|nr:4-(cytidine 5'-diphospho)-2-C-methyl-D-erythritol kinase [Thorsellia anophelis]SET48917.1 4-diphosphocytidyl-2-C-methyl-D-erythritol kinase [Thorsellia anophelis DSM 18579]
MPLRLLSPAKINLFLSITSQRADGYHNLETLFQLLDVGDTLTFEANLTNMNKVDYSKQYPAINLTYSKQTLNNPFTQILSSQPLASNLIIKAANQLVIYAKENQLTESLCDIAIEIDKILPMGAGLGGGSSNAAATLLALNHLWKLNIKKEVLAKIGLTIGADVPIFIEGHSAFATGVGEIITPVSLEESWYLLIFPNTSVSTGELFKDPNLVRTSSPKTYEQWQNCAYYNVFEPLARQHYSEIDKAITWLSQYADTRMTGTGSTIFARFESKSSAQAILDLAPSNWWGTITKGMNKWNPLSGILP